MPVVQVWHLFLCSRCILPGKHSPVSERTEHGGQVGCISLGLGAVPPVLLQLRHCLVLRLMIDLVGQLATTWPGVLARPQCGLGPSRDGEELRFLWENQGLPRLLLLWHQDVWGAPRLLPSGRSSSCGGFQGVRLQPVSLVLSYPALWLLTLCSPELTRVFCGVYENQLSRGALAGAQVAP